MKDKQEEENMISQNGDIFLIKQQQQNSEGTAEKWLIQFLYIFLCDKTLQINENTIEIHNIRTTRKCL